MLLKSSLTINVSMRFNMRIVLIVFVNTKNIYFRKHKYKSLILSLLLYIVFAINSPVSQENTNFKIEFLWWPAQSLQYLLSYATSYMKLKWDLSKVRLSHGHPFTLQKLLTRPFFLLYTVKILNLLLLSFLMLTFHIFNNDNTIKYY